MEAGSGIEAILFTTVSLVSGVDSERMKILQLAPRMPFPLTDGGAIGIYNITKFLAKAGHDVTLVTYPLDTEEETAAAISDISKFATVHVVSRRLPSRAVALANSMFRGAYPIERRMMPEMETLLAQITSSTTFDVLHVDHAHMGRYGLQLRDKLGIPTILREHNFESQIYDRFARTARNPLKRWIATIHGRRLRREETHFLRSFDAVAAITPEDARLIREAAPEALIEVIPAGVDTEFFQPTSPELERPKSVLWIGGLDWDPNKDALSYFLSDIWPLILAELPDTMLDIVGAKTELFDRKTEKWGNSVNIHGRVPDIRDYLRASAVLVVPLRVGGGMRLKLVEFFAAGKAVVSSTIGAEGNQAANERELLIRDNPDEFATAVVQLLQDPSGRRVLGKNARELALAEYSWAQIANRFGELYDRVLRRATRVSA
jgi:glycosyltransferase involved in cell wall biosynthesis